jgi:hypothetical protein
VGNINRAVVVGATENVQRVARGNRARWLVLTLEVRIAVWIPRAGHHIHVGAWNDLLLADYCVAENEQDEGSRDGAQRAEESIETTHGLLDEVDALCRAHRNKTYDRVER